jgi:hypothetical protein
MRLESVCVWLESRIKTDPVGARGLRGVIEDLSCPCLSPTARLRAVSDRALHGIVCAIRKCEKVPAHADTTTPSSPVNPDQPNPRPKGRGFSFLNNLYCGYKNLQLQLLGFLKCLDAR